MVERKKRITVQAEINAPVKEVWKKWTSPEDIFLWNFASDDWHSPHAENELFVGGTFSYRMEAKDGSVGFDFGGEYTNIKPLELIGYTLGDGRKAEIRFSMEGSKTLIVETFDAEKTNPPDLQKNGWQAILNNFKKYVETN
jgi:uncharacterized protein YndB with AHSA1/START domain